jgi:hypothetical protein
MAITEHYGYAEYGIPRQGEVAAACVFRQESAKPDQVEGMRANQIADIAATAGELFTTLQAEGFGKGKAFSLVYAAMPAIIGTVAGR